ncbi:MAG: 3'(2'),5'-bisphosphate nucleotidase CysQ [Psychroflexus sp.]|nr:3'(2'),5'-bisphosphate nucleotidase CysQ [Psychroflexus sp.]MDN6309889.1 3'(2'),5'-bisphosphate nucleotidase CysQ [Psychroflexus sp.]
MEHHKELAVKASIEAGEAIMQIYKEDIIVEMKDDNSPLTIADKRANSIIMDYLEQTDFPIISEENKAIDYAERKKWPACWIVDPLDGTKEFIKKNGEFTVNIALVHEQKTVFGVIYVPATRELYIGDVEKNKALKLEVPEVFELKTLMASAEELSPKAASDKIEVVGSRSHMNEDTKNYIEDLKSTYNKPVEIVSKGSSLKFCLVAEGKADVYPRYAPTMEWDTAAGQAICKAVGLSVINLDTGEEMLYNRENLLNSYFHVSALS